MYWIYLILFILAVFTPLIIQNDLYFLNEEVAEAISIFFLLTISFLLFLWKERELIRNIREKSKIQKEASLMNRDLTNSYLYIGESNRKLEILKNIVLRVPSLPSSESQKKEAFEAILEAVFILSRSRDFTIRFVDAVSEETVEEIKSRKKINFTLGNKAIIKNIGNYFEDDNYSAYISPRNSTAIISSIILSKKGKQQKIEDPDMIRVLAAQALYIFCLTQNNLSAIQLAQ